MFARLNDDEVIFLGIVLEGFFYGIYSGIFAMYLQYQISKKDTNFTTQNRVIFSSLCALHVLSTVVFVCDILFLKYPATGNTVLQTISFGCCDVIAQFILIYRCWIVWGRNTRVVIIPSILTLAFLGTWLSYNGSMYVSGPYDTPGWAAPVILTSLVMSLTVNALVTGLIVFRIFKVFRGVSKTLTDEKILGATDGSKLRSIIFILIESGMALFSIQLARLLISIVFTVAASRAFNIVVPIHQMLNGITPTIILVRTSMGLSFHDEKSMEEVAVGSLRFASSHLDSNSEAGGINIGGQYRGDDDDIEVPISDVMETRR